MALMVAESKRSALRRHLPVSEEIKVSHVLLDQCALIWGHLLNLGQLGAIAGLITVVLRSQEPECLDIRIL